MDEKRLRGLLVELLEASEHPEIVSASTTDDRGEEGAASISVKFDDNSATYLYVYPENGWPKQKSLAEKRRY